MRLPTALALLLLGAASTTHGYNAEANDATALFLRGGAASDVDPTVYQLLEDNSVKVSALREAFLQWVEEHKRVYETVEEDMKRMLTWIENHEFIERHNSQEPEPSYTLGHNAFSDLTNDEFNQLNGLGKYSAGVDTVARAKRAAQKRLTLGDKDSSSDDEEEAVQRRLGSSSSDESKKKKKHKLPKKVDWVSAGAVTGVKNQGQCGSCWAFSAIGALEGAHFLKTGELVSLSEQELLDCDTKDKGCFGGLMDIAFEFDEKGRGVCKEEDYPYEAAKNDSCNKKCEPVDETIVKSFTDVEEGSVKALQKAIVQQPVSIAIQANQMSFQFYKKGIFNNEECGEDAVIDHGVLAVGYGSTKGKKSKDYWVVKNSWGATWGDNGYIKMSRKSKNEYGMCSILKMPSYPELV